MPAMLKLYKAQYKMRTWLVISWKELCNNAYRVNSLDLSVSFSPSNFLYLKQNFSLLFKFEVKRVNCSYINERYYLSLTK